jgi:hypothetical protein
LGAGVDKLVVRWIDDTGYEWGLADVSPQPDYADLPAEQPAILASEAKLTIPPGTPPGSYKLQIGVQQAPRPFKMSTESSQLTIVPSDILADSTSLTITNQLNQAMSPEITLLGYTPPTQPLTGVAPTWLTLYWQATDISPDAQVIIRLLDATGHEVTRWQGKPAYGHHPTNEWQVGEIVKDVWKLQVMPDVAIGEYTLEVSLNQNDRNTVNIPVEVWLQPLNFDKPSMQQELSANFDNQLTMLGYDLFLDVTDQQTLLSPTFYWQSLADMETAFDLQLTLQEADSNQTIQVWRVPLGEAKTAWKINEVVGIPYQFEVNIASEQQYHLELALYEHGATHPLDLIDSDSVRLENIQDKVVVRLNE